MLFIINILNICISIWLYVRNYNIFLNFHMLETLLCWKFQFSIIIFILFLIFKIYMFFKYKITFSVYSISKLPYNQETSEIQDLSIFFIVLTNILFFCTFFFLSYRFYAIEMYFDGTGTIRIPIRFTTIDEIPLHTVIGMSIKKTLTYEDREEYIKYLIFTTYKKEGDSVLLFDSLMLAKCFECNDINTLNTEFAKNLAICNKFVRDNQSYSNKYIAFFLAYFLATVSSSTALIYIIIFFL